MYAQNFSWRQYLTAADYMDFNRDSQNNMVRLMNNRKASATDLKVARRHVDEAKSRFLATIFNRSIRYVDISTQHVSREYSYVATQTESNAVYFRHFDDVKFQVVLFWWVGLMNYLQKSFPECFKVSPAKNPQQADPLQMRVRTTAALEKYLNGSEESVYRENYMNQLQHLSDMIKQGKEMEKLNNKR